MHGGGEEKANKEFPGLSNSSEVCLPGLLPAWGKRKRGVSPSYKENMKAFVLGIKLANTAHYMKHVD